MIFQNQNLCQVNNALNKKIDLLKKKNTCSKNQLNAMIIFIYKYISLKTQEKGTLKLRNSRHLISQHPSLTNSLYSSYNQWNNEKKQRRYENFFIFNTETPR